MELLVKLLENGLYLRVHSITSRRMFSGSAVVCSRYDPKVFREPIVDLEQVVFIICDIDNYIVY